MIFFTTKQPHVFFARAVLPQRFIMLFEMRIPFQYSNMSSVHSYRGSKPKFRNKFLSRTQLLVTQPLLHSPQSTVHFHCPLYPRYRARYHRHMMAATFSILHVTFMSLSWHFHGAFMSLSWRFHVTFMALSCHFYGAFKALSWRFHVTFMPFSCRFRAVFMRFSRHFVSRYMPGFVAFTI
jgi:hypothetical protein